MTEPTISLIIPAYNEEKYIGSCLEYVLKNSNGKLFEILVIDNASTDQTGEIAKRFPGVRVIQEMNKGVMHARQRGFVESSSDLVAFIDADTRIPVGWCERIISEFTRNEKLVCLSGRSFYYDLSYFQNIGGVIFWLLAMPVYYCIGYMANHCNVVLRRDVLMKMNGLNTSIDFYGDDTDTARRAHLFGTVMFSFSFAIGASGRRFLKEGFFKPLIPYIKNFFSQVFTHTSVTKEHNDIR